MTEKLIITRGLPASGKTTRARAWVAEDTVRRARVNRDDLRAGLHGGWLGSPDQERQVTAVQHAAVLALLNRGVDVVVDDTNLAQRHARELRRLADRVGAWFEVWDMTDVPLQTCIERDDYRGVEGGMVGADVIRDMHRRYLAGRSYPLPFPDEPAEDAPSGPVRYVPPEGKPSAVLVDIDGTVAMMCARSPYDETRVCDDAPNEPVIAAVRAMYAAGHRVVFLSGRTAGCREATEKWLRQHVGVPFDGPFMRPVGDMRKDSIVKVELFDRHVRGEYRVVCVFDDRRQVVEAWRALGLTVMQVAEGDF